MKARDYAKRLRACHSCPSPCRRWRVEQHTFLENSESECPIHRWPLLLGDAVARIAQPIARAVDKLAGTKLEDCGGCTKRREKLNALHRRLNQQP